MLDAQSQYCTLDHVSIGREFVSIRRRTTTRTSPFAGEATMSKAVKAIPDGYLGATPYLCIKGAAAALDFYKQAFGAVETMRIAAPGDKIGHAEFKIGDAPIMLADEFPEMGFSSPGSLGGSPV